MFSYDPVPIPTPTPRPTSDAPAEFAIPLDLVNIQLGNEAIQGWHMIGIGDQLQATTLIITFFMCLALIAVTFKKTFSGDK